MPRSFQPGLLALAVMGLICAFPASTAAGILPTQTNQVTLSCTDGHSVVLWVDSATLTSLTADVAAINSSGTGTTCTLNTTAVDPSSETTDWTVYDYNPSTQEIAPRNSPNSMPATTSGSTTMFNFLSGNYTALLTTTDPSLTGDQSMTTLSDQIQLTGPATTFETQHGGGDCVGNRPAAVRFYFTSPAASGPSVGTSPPGTGGTTGTGFYTQFWWSNPVNLPMNSGNQGPTTISANMYDPSEWSDWNGQSGANPAVTPAFETAISHVQSIGLSFGGECFFETGVASKPTTRHLRPRTRRSPATSASPNPYRARGRKLEVRTDRDERAAASLQPPSIPPGAVTPGLNSKQPASAINLTSRLSAVLRLWSATPASLLPANLN
jgi:hypothetical protein